MFRKLTAILLTLALLFPTAALGADLLHESKTTETIASGITYTHLTRMHDTGFSQIHILDADLNNETVSFKPLIAPKGMSYLTSVLNMAKDAGAVAAINTDFFSWNKSESGRGHAMNLQVTDGKLLSSSGIDTGYASLIQTEAGELLMDYFKSDITVTAPNGTSASVFLVNQYTDINYLMLYTAEWGSQSLGSQNDGSELVVADGKVVEIRQNQGPCVIPENGYILSLGNATYNTFLTANFAVGDPVTLDICLTPDTDAVRQAVSGGSMLVKDGTRAEFTHNISGKNPRSGIGFTADGHLLLVAVDGRQQNAVGMTQEDLADLFIELGATYALNCDGGGSTTMVTRSQGSFDVTLQNTPSGGSMRSVSAAVGLFSNAPIGSLAAIDSTLSSDTVFLGDSVSVYSVGTDTFDNPCDLSDKNVTYHTDNGTMNGNVLTPQRAGTATVTVSAGDVSTTVTVTVLDAPKSITTYPSEAELELNKEQSFIFIGYGENGTSALISPHLVTLTSDSDALLISDNRVILKNSKGGALTASFGNCQTVIPVTAVNEMPSFRLALKEPTGDPLYQKNTENVLFPIIQTPTTGNTLLDRLTGYQFKSALKNAGYTQLLNVSSQEIDVDIPQTTAGSYQKTENNGVLVITTDFSSLSLLKQWKQLFADLKSSNASNILILMNQSYSFKISDEQALFEDELQTLSAQGKTIFVVTPGEKTACSFSNGVHYMTVSDCSNLSLKDYAIAKERWCYPEFSLQENQLTYRFVSLL